MNEKGNSFLVVPIGVLFIIAGIIVALATVTQTNHIGLLVGIGTVMAIILIAIGGYILKSKK